MRRKILFLPILATLMLAGCSTDDDLTTGGNENEGNGEASYLAVNIVTPKTIMGRAATSTDFEEGDPEENEAQEGLFLFFNASGNQTQTPQTVNLDWQENSATDDPAIEKVSKAVVVIAGNTQPTQLLVILNAPTDLNVNGKTLTEVRAIADDYNAVLDESNDNKCKPLVITNSTYKNANGNEVCATAISSNLHKDKTEAENDPVNVYVERVVAKVKTSAIGDDFTQGAKINVDGNDVTLSQTIEGIEIANIAERSYLFKSISGFNSWAWTDWNDVANFRSYWATCPDQLTYANQSWNVIDNTDPTSAQTFYIQENTSATKSCVLVTATLKKDGQPYDFVRWAGNYYTPNNFLNMYCTLLKNAGFKVKTDNNGSTRTINTTDIAWLSDDEHKQLVNNKNLKGYETTVQLTETAKDLTFIKGEGTSSADNVNEFLLEKENRVWYWKDGKAYYFVDIEHFGTDGFNVGVVRNHIYNLNLKSLTGVGVAVFNPDEIIIPEKPSDDLYYLAAKINILKWKLVNQDVNFE